MIEVTREREKGEEACSVIHLLYISGRGKWLIEGGVKLRSQLLQWMYNGRYYLTHFFRNVFFNLADTGTVHDLQN